MYVRDAACVRSQDNSLISASIIRDHLSPSVVPRNVYEQPLLLLYVSDSEALPQFAIESLYIPAPGPRVSALN